MDSTLHALGEILLKAVPTFLLVILLNFYLKKMFFRPLEHVLEKRYEATEGARKLAEESLERAAARTAEYEAAMRAARAEAYQAQERLHKRLQNEQAAQFLEARQHTEALVKQARAELMADMEQAKAALGARSDALAEQIAAAVLRRSAA
jgi:F-type H+-transporting ATPase subunit b